MFVNDIYRSLYIEDSNNEYWDGIFLRRYIIQDKDLLNATANPENAQYYNFGPSGMLNATMAAGIPTFITRPHFLGGDPVLIGAVEGLSPMKEVHQTYLDIEPQTGLLAKAHKRLQLVYQINSLFLPTTKNDTVENVNAICENLLYISAALNQTTNLTCDHTALSSLFTCLAENVSYHVANDNIFFPYGWVDGNNLYYI